jgi:hypothetical protein
MGIGGIHAMVDLLKPTASVLPVNYPNDVTLGET